MNRQCFRLVKRRTTDSVVPVWEGARRRRRDRRGAGGAGLAAVLLATSVLAQTPAPNALPVPVLPVDSANIAASGAATAHLDAARAALDITQSTQRAVIDWQSFNVGANASVTFHHLQGASSATLNRIHDIAPSVIQGALRANGEIYLLNDNGVIFRDGAQVNTGSLVVSALRLHEDAFNRGLLSLPAGTAAFEWGGSRQQFEATEIRVDAGATVRSAQGGRVMMLAPRVVNHGSVETPEGQTVLAAGAKVFLTAPTNAALRGFLVEVDPFTERDGTGATVATVGGSVSNEVMGRIVAERGNVSLVGIALKQNGVAAASTSVLLNGSVLLVARDSVTQGNTVATTVVDNVAIPRGTRTGSVEFGAGSITEVRIDSNPAQTLQDAQSFTRSAIDTVGRTIIVQRDARIAAPGGDIALTAMAGQILQTPGSAPVEGVRVYVDRGAIVDASGTADTRVSAARNFIAVELRGNELRDSPLQRDGVLRGKTVTIDTRLGTPVGDVSGYLGQVGRTASERAAAGGNITLVSEGDVVLRDGSRLDVSGGAVEVMAGTVAGETLVRGADGKTYRMSQAHADLVYTGIVGQVQEFQAGYRDGKSAGTITVVSHRAVLDGTLAGSAEAGERQRVAGKVPLGGLLVLGDASEASSPQADFKIPGIVFARDAMKLPDAFTATAPLEGEWTSVTRLSTVRLQAAGFTRFAGYTNGLAEVVDPLTLAPGGSLALTARQIRVAGDIRIPSGSIALTTRDVLGGNVTRPESFALTVADGVTLDVAGLWVNDRREVRSGVLSDPVAVRGGSIALRSASDLTLGSRTVLDVSGGAHVPASGRLSAGDAGSIVLATGRIGRTDSDRQVSVLSLGGDLRGFGVATDLLAASPVAAKGGSLSLVTSSIRVGNDGPGVIGELRLPATFAGQGGFNRVTLSGQDGVDVDAGVSLALMPLHRVVGGSDLLRGNGTSIGAFATVARLPDAVSGGSRLSLISPGVEHGHVTVGRGATVEVTPTGEIVLQSGRSVTVLGTLRAPGGSVTVANDPAGSSERFDPTVTLWLGAGAAIDVSGRSLVRTDAQGRLIGDVLAGGSITLAARKGSLVAEAGASLDASGGLGALDVATYRTALSYERRTLASAGGSITLSAREGILSDARLRAAAGGLDAMGGTLTVTMDEPPSGLDFPGNPKRIVVVPDGPFVVAADGRFPDGIAPGAVVEIDPASSGSAVNGRAFLSAKQVRDGGFHTLALKARDAVEFLGDVVLDVPREFRIEAPAIGTVGPSNATLTSAYVRLGSSELRPLEKAAIAGTGTLSATAGLIDVVGRLAMQGSAVTTLRSTGDLRLVGTVIDTDTNPNADSYGVRGSFVTAGQLSLAAAQVYPTSMSRFSIRAEGSSAAAVVISSPRPAVDRPIHSAAGSLTIVAPRIDHGGVLRAPFGEIVLQASGQLDLRAGSLTSVSGEGLVLPLGRTEQSGSDYVYALGGSYGSQLLSTLPAKRVMLDSPVTNLAGKVDVSGGGELFAYEFVPGPGGSKDVLDPAVSPTSFAILPALGSAPAPADVAYEAGTSGLRVGDRVRLSGVRGLPDGSYTLLPARFALLPGAFLVTPRAGTVDFSGEQAFTRTDGSQVVSGQRVALLADGAETRSARLQGFLVESNAVVRARAQYSITTATDFFETRDSSSLPRDAGQVRVAASDSVTLDGTFVGRIGAGGRGADVDLAVPRLAVTGGGASALAGYLVLDPATLNRLGAASLLLGGYRDRSDGGVQVTTTATDVVVEAGGEALTGPEILLVARNSLTVRAGAAIEARGTVGSSPASLAVAGNGALLRASTAAEAAIVRSGADRSLGTLVIESSPGAVTRLVAPGSLTLDASRATSVSPDAQLSSRSISLAAGRVSIGDVPEATEGLVLTPALLAQAGAAESVSIRSYGALDLYGDVTLGAVDDAGRPRLNALTLAAGRWIAHGSETKRITAASIRLLGTDPEAPAFAGTPDAGAVMVHAASDGQAGGLLTVGDGTARLDGASRWVLRADRALRFEGEGRLQSSSDLRIEAAVVVADTLAAHGVHSGGVLEIGGPGGPSSVVASGLGARLDFEGETVRLDGSVALPSGQLTLRARGPGGVSVGSAGRIDVAGRPVVFGEREVRASGGGRVRIVADQGDIALAEGSLVDVGAARMSDGSGTRLGDAGRLEFVATQGTVHADGVLTGQAGAGSRAGEFRADTATLDAFGSLNAVLNAGLFADRDLRLRDGDLVVAAGQTVTASRFVVSADRGAITVLGNLDAQGDEGGSIALWASGDVVLAGGSRIDATPGTDGGRGGRLTIGTTAGEIDVRSGSVIALSSSRPGAPTDGSALGQIWLRAPRSGNDVSIRALDAAVDVATGGSGGAPVGRSGIVVEAVTVYAARTIAATGQTGVGGVFNLSTADNASTRTFREDAVYRETAAYVTAAKSTVLSRLGADIRFLAGIEIRSDSNLVLNADWNLCGTGNGCTGTAAWRFGGEPGVLSLRAAGDLNLSRSLSDGFNGATSTATQQVGASWSYRIAGGADLSAANPMRIVELPVSEDASTEIGTVSLAAGRLVRTGTGFIEVAAGRDVVLASDQSVIYTAGSPTATQPAALVDFVVPRYTLPAIPTPTYPMAGGDLTITAARDLRGTASGQLVSEWLYRQAWRLRGVALDETANPQHTWWVRFDTFRQGVGALGGGDVRIEAGGDIRDFSAVVPTNARLGGPPTVAPDARYFVEQGGGDLSVRAGGDVRGGVYYVQKGTAFVEAGGDIAASEQLTPDGQPLHTIVALGDGRSTLRAVGAATLETAFNPTVQAQPSGNAGTNGRAATYFFTYGESSAVTLEALTGTATLANQQQILPKLPVSALASRSAEAATTLVYPGSVSVTAFNADVAVERTFTMFPSASGQLDLLAAGSVLVRGTINMSDVSPAWLPGALSRHGVAPGAPANVLTPDLTFTQRDGIRELLVDAVEQGARFHDTAILHARDGVPIRLLASTGDIRGPGSFGDDVPFGLFAEPVIAVAGRDIRDVWIYGQNVREDDVSLFQAGRDVRYGLLRDALGGQRANNGRLEWGGPGSLVIAAGRDVDLGNSQGIVTRGNFNNPFLPESGATIRVSTGSTRPDYEGFLQRYFTGGTEASRTYGVELAAAITAEVLGLGPAPTLAQVRDALVARYGGRIVALPDEGARRTAQAEFDAVVATVDGLVARDGDRPATVTELQALYRALPADGADSVQRALLDDAVAVFSARPPERQAATIQDVLFRELRGAGRDPATNRESDYPRGYRALLALFPLAGGPTADDPLTDEQIEALRPAFARTYGGDVRLFFSQIKTEQGGGVDIVVPGGLVNAGLANPGALTKSAAELGIVTVRGGGVRAAVSDDFQVNQSRVFTLRGGDIVLWSSYGDIDAGKGAKTAAATPPPRVVFRGDRFVLDTSKSVEGSGIGALTSATDVVAGDVVLIAPGGSIDAGDAGVRGGNVIGDCNAKQRPDCIKNSDNFVGNFSPPPPPASAGGQIAMPASDVSAEATKAAAKAADAAAERAAAQAVAQKLSFITVDVVGFGPSSGAPTSTDGPVSSAAKPPTRRTD